VVTIPSLLVGRIAIVTGANTGIGLEVASALAAAGATTVLACRNDQRAASGREQILRRHPDADVELLRLDLADLVQVTDAAAEATARFGRVHLCVNNAGLMVRSRSTTAQGFETTFGVNHLGHFAWTGLLLPALLAAPDSRILTVTSLAHLQAKMDWADLMGTRRFKPTVAYRRSKVANLLHSFELQRRLATSELPGTRDTSALAAHPGVAATTFWENAAGPTFAWAARLFDAVIAVLFSTTSEGAVPVLYAATSEDVVPGQCYGPSVAQRWGRPGVVRSSQETLDVNAATRLWDISEELTGVKVL
jgi:NAD(P)-dependent dehydrogenase (short-subunit alcohol dehydrogenase family)